jgi:hypothetical protein
MYVVSAVLQNIIAREYDFIVPTLLGPKTRLKRSARKAVLAFKEQGIGNAPVHKSSTMFPLPLN